MTALRKPQNATSIILMLAFAIHIPIAQADIRYVDAAANGANNGSSWVDAYWTLQDALQTSTKGDEIRVAQGIYRPDQITKNVRGKFVSTATGDRRATFLLKNGITIKGGFAGIGEPDPDSRDVGLYRSHLSGDLYKDDGPGFSNYKENSYHVVTCSESSTPCVLNGFTVTGGNANGPLPENHGGGISTDGSSSLVVSNCTIHGNRAQLGAGIHCTRYSEISVANCKLFGNEAQWGGGMYTVDTKVQITNCVFYDNAAETGAGLSANKLSQVLLENCTFTRNQSSEAGGGIWLAGGNTVSIVNSILWNDIPNEIGLGTYGRDIADVSYSNIQGGWLGNGNIGSDPLFVDTDGLDDIPGNEDDDFRLRAGSPCVNAGDNSVLGRTYPTDLGGTPRVLDDTVDMGAYEGAVVCASDVYYVNAITGDDHNHGLNSKNALATIQAGINLAQAGNSVLVYPGVYIEAISFGGKAITVKGVATRDGIPVLENPGEIAVSFFSGEGPDSVLQNLVIRNSDFAVFLVGSSPTLNHLTVVDNQSGIGAYEGADPIIINSIFWRNTFGDLFQTQAHYSCLEQTNDNPTNISADPLFVDPAQGDYHLLSNRGRHWIVHDVWILDEQASPCLDVGDPMDDFSQEPLPNGGRVNMGAYGGTPQASMSEMPKEGVQ